MKTTITEQGLALINAVVADSAQLTFTKMEIGDGVNINTSSLVTNLINKRLEVSISEVYASEDGSVVCANVENSGVEESFEIREIGVFAKKADSNDEPILFAYVECEGIGGIPASNIVSVNNEIRVTIVTGQANVIYIDNTEDVSSLKEKVDELSKSLEEDYSTKKEIDELEDSVRKNYCKKTEIAVGVNTQTIFGHDPISGADSNINIYLTGNTLTVSNKGHLVSFPLESGTLALAEDVSFDTDKGYVWTKPQTLANDATTINVAEGDAINQVKIPCKTGTLAIEEEVDVALNLAKWQAYANIIIGESGFAQEYALALEKYLADPMATEWNTANSTTSTNPYYTKAPTKPVVDLSVTVANSSLDGLPSFNSNTNVAIFLPNATDLKNCLSNNTVFNSPFIAPSATNLSKAFYYATSFIDTLIIPNATNCSNMLRGANLFNNPLYLPKATNCEYMLYNAKNFNQDLSLPNATNCSYMLNGAISFASPLYLPNATNCNGLLYNAVVFNQPLSLPKATECKVLLYGATAFNQAVSLPSCVDATNAFNNTNMSAENISKTLDSLPTWEDGAEHVITFTGATGASSLTQSSPSVASAIAKGWTVILK